MTKRSAIFIAKLVVTAGLLFVVLRALDWHQVANRLDALTPGPLVLAALCLAAQLVLVVSWRWSVILTALGAPFAARRLFMIVTMSVFFHQFLPSTIGGDGMRIWFLQRGGTALGLTTRSVIIDRVCGLFALMLMGFFGSLAMLSMFPTEGALWFALALTLTGIVCVIGAPLLLRLSAWLPDGKLRSNLQQIANEVRSIQRDRVVLAKILLVSVLGHVLISLAVWLTGRGIGVEFSLLLSQLILPSVLFLAALPISIAGWGVREGSMVVGLGLLGVSTTDAALVSVFFGLILLILGLIGGSLWLLYRGPKPTNHEASGAGSGTNSVSSNR